MTKAFKDVYICIKYTVNNIVIIIISPNIAHHDIDKGVLYKGEEDEESARRHEHVNRLRVKYNQISCCCNPIF